MTKRSGQKPPQRVTIRDVARLADTSIATGSYVLNNENRYPRPELRDRVLAAARELGYVKNAPACSLKGKRRGILAILVPEFGNSFFTRMCVPVEAVASREGYIVTICAVTTSLTRNASSSSACWPSGLTAASSARRCH